MSLSGGAKDDRYTYDLGTVDGGPRVPDEDDLGGSEHVNEDPNPQEGVDPSAGANNEQVRNLAGLNRVNAIARICVEIDGGGNPIVVYASGMGTQITTSSFEIVVFVPGHLHIRWAENVLPPLRGKPRAFSNTSLHSVHADVLSSDPNAIDVTTWMGTSLANAAFTVDL
jgi:hypothetical protein